MNYKDHQIEVSVRGVDDPKGWSPDIFVSYSEHGKGVLKSLRVDRTFATPNEAEKAGIELRKNGSMTASHDPRRDRARDG